MTREQKIVTAEAAAIILLWSFAFTFPLLFGDSLYRNWWAIHIMWIELSIVASVFLVNRFVLTPNLFFAKRYIEYVFAVVLLLLLVAIFIFYFDGVNIIAEFLDKDGQPNTLHGVGGYSVAPPTATPSVVTPPVAMPPMAMPHTAMPLATTPPMGGMPVQLIPPAVLVVVFTVIIIALDLGLNIATRWIITEHKQAELNKERITAQLSNLQNQVSPHFFMNTLNNIHALVEIDAHRAQKTIIELSALMDYLLYESATVEMVALNREMEFLESYINLMRLRYPERVRIEFSYTRQVPQVKIPPLLFLNFIENSFKYGVDYSKESFIKIHFNLTETYVEMYSQNSNHADSVKKKRGGLGIENSRKRATLLFGKRYELKVNGEGDVFDVYIKIPVV